MNHGFWIESNAITSVRKIELSAMTSPGVCEGYCVEGRAKLLRIATALLHVSVILGIPKSKHQHNFSYA